MTTKHCANQAFSGIIEGQEKAAFRGPLTGGVSSAPVAIRLGKVA